MPTVDIDPDELRRLTGRPGTDDETLKGELFSLGLEFEGETDAGDLRFEFEPDRLDRLSVEGVARSLRYQYGDDRGLDVPSTNDPDWTIEVDGVPDERPYVTGAVIRGVDLDEAALESLLQLQEKLHATMGRKRVKGAIGVHDLAMLKGESLDADGAGTAGPAIRYTGIGPDGDRFVPLDSDAEMTPAGVLADHPVGDDYAPLVADYDRFPAIYDEIGLFSFPPVINGRRTEVTTDSRELFVEMTGTDQWTIDRMLNVVCYALDARGATIEEVVVDAPDGRLVRPDFSTRVKTVAHDRIEGLLGVDLDTEAVIDLLERSGLGVAAVDDGAYDVEIPPYRVDVLHPVDVVDDVGRAYGFNELAPRYPDVGTIGGRHERSRLAEAVRTRLVGLGFQDLLNFHMTSESAAYERLGLSVPAPGDDGESYGADPPARISTPYSEDYTILRPWLLSSVFGVLENNTHRAYPQDLAEVGFVAHRDDDRATRVAERRAVAGALARTEASYEAIKGRLAVSVDAFGGALATPPIDHPTFIDGRTAAVEIDGEARGVIGEVRPRVLVEHDLEVPVAAFEFDLAALR